MSTAPQTPQPAAENQNRRKKVRVVMASGLVLGVGAAVTLAAWSDTVWGEGTFGTGDSAFNIQASFDGGNKWDEFMTPDKAGPMDFGTEATGLMPGDSVYAMVGLKEQFDKMDAKVSLTKVTADDSVLKDLISVRVSQPTAEKPSSCADAEYGDPVNLSAANAEMLPEFTIPGGGTRWVCFSATLSDTILPQTAPTTAKAIQWKFDGMSVEKAAAPA